MHPRKEGSRFVFPSPPGNRELHMLDKCKNIAGRVNLARIIHECSRRADRQGFRASVRAWERKIERGAATRRVGAVDWRHAVGRKQTLPLVQSVLRARM